MEKSNVEKFTGKAEIYNKYRSYYASKCIEDIINNANKQKELIIADIGAGTGKLTEQFLKKGIKVIAVEPNKDMLNIAKENLKEYQELLQCKHEVAENTTIENNSIDIITVAQAFHWFDKNKFKKECKRILKTEGIIAIMWNFIDYKQELENKIIKIHKKYTDITFNASDEEKRDKEILDFYGENNFKLKIYENNYKEDKESFIGRQLSMSYALKEDHKEFKRYVNEFENLFNEYNKNGIIEIHNNTYCYIGKIL